MSSAVMVALAAMVVFFIISKATAGPRISGAQAREKVASGALLVDVRSPGEFKSGHIKGARNIPHTDVQRRVSELGAKDGEIVLYCASGMRSAHAARALKSMGFSAVHNLGPKTAW